MKKELNKNINIDDNYYITSNISRTHLLESIAGKNGDSF